MSHKVGSVNAPLGRKLYAGSVGMPLEARCGRWRELPVNVGRVHVGAERDENTGRLRGGRRCGISFRWLNTTYYAYLARRPRFYTGANL